MNECCLRPCRDGDPEGAKGEDGEDHDVSCDGDPEGAKGEDGEDHDDDDYDTMNGFLIGCPGGYLCEVESCQSFLEVFRLKE